MSILGIKRENLVRLVFILIGISVVTYLARNNELSFKTLPERRVRLSWPNNISIPERQKNDILNLENISSESALVLYREQLSRMKKKGCFEVKTLNASPVSYDNSETPRHHHFLDKLQGNPTWEPETFADFNHWLPKHKYYVGFGTWIGITLFYATQFVEKSVGFEGDPVAFAMVQTNLNWNNHRHWYNHTHVYPVAVLQGSSKESEGEVITMRSSWAGGSCSFVGDFKTKAWCGKVGTSWKIKGYTLPHLLNLTNIPSSDETYIKIDVESYEWDLIPSWVNWLKNNLQNKPTMRISFHNNRRCGPQQVFEQLITFSNLYKGVWMDGKKTTLSQSFNLTNCLIRTLVFSDHEY